MKEPASDRADHNAAASQNIAAQDGHSDSIDFGFRTVQRSDKAVLVRGEILAGCGVVVRSVRGWFFHD